LALVLCIFVEPTPNVNADAVIEGRQPGFAFERHFNVRWGKGETVQFYPALAGECTFDGPNYDLLKRAILSANRLNVRCAKQHWFGGLSAVEVATNGVTVLSRSDAIASRRLNNRILTVIAVTLGALWLSVIAISRARVANIPVKA
jgi:hypothetical protein